MSTLQTANAEQISYWNEVSGPKWVALADRIDAQLAPLSAAALERAAAAPGERVLDIGCGCGHTTVALARQVGPEGRVVGVDISRPMLASAEERATRSPGAKVRFVLADAQTHSFESDPFDLVFSRFGVMFFDAPEAAFANLLRALRPGGRLVFVCWQELGKNPWMAVPAIAASKHVALARPADPHAPGPFAFADRERLAKILGTAGFTGVEVASLERKLTVGQGLARDEIVDFLLQMGPAGAAVRAAPDPAALLTAVRATLHEALAPYDHGDGLVMDSAAWLVSARREA